MDPMCSAIPICSYEKQSLGERKRIIRGKSFNKETEKVEKK
jgi:hypothetical protein